jgi:hypothetical protein
LESLTWPGAEAEVLAFGRAFYGRILRRSDSALLEGNLPRIEAEQGLKQLDPAVREGRSNKASPQ